MKSNKVVIVTNIPSPYRIPLFNELSEQLLKDNKVLVVIFGNKTYSRRKFKAVPESEFKFEYIYLDSETIDFGNQEKTYFSYKNLFKTFKKINPLCVIISGFTFATTRLWLDSYFNKRPYIIWTGSILHSGRNDSLLRKIQRKLLIKRSSAFITYGTKASEYLLKLNAPSSKVFIGINTVDTTFYNKETQALKGTNPTNKFHLTYIGYFSKRKNVLKLLEVIKFLKLNRDDFILDLIGDGPEKELLQEYTVLNNLGNNVKFHGFKQKEELPKLLAMSSCFLFQTDFDIWGLVLNEAMAAGIPVIATNNAGATSDLIINGQTGYIGNFDNPEEICDLINCILNDKDNAMLIGQNAAKYIEQNASVYISANGFLNAIKVVLD